MPIMQFVDTANLFGAENIFGYAAPLALRSRKKHAKTSLKKIRSLTYFQQTGR